MMIGNKTKFRMFHKRVAPWIGFVVVAVIACVLIPTRCHATLTTVPDLSGNGHTGTLGTGFVGATSPVLNGSYAAFTNYTDTINLAGNVSLTNHATYEATILVNSTSYTTPANNGIIWNAWANSAEDSRITVHNGGAVAAYSYPVNNPNDMEVGSLQTGVWYDLAYVYDGSQERIYINGALAGSRSASGNIGLSTGDTMTLGAIYRNGIIVNAVDGDIASVRISNTARYSGSSYNAISGPGDFPADASTQLLFDFAPVPEPTSVSMVIVLGAAGLARRRRRI